MGDQPQGMPEPKGWTWWPKTIGRLTRRILKSIARFIWSFVGPLFGPWASLKGRRFQFISWLLVVPVIGLAGFWLPLVLLYARGMAAYPVFEQLIHAGNMASLCVAVLSEGLVALLLTEESGSHLVALGIRAVVGGWVIGLVVLLVGVMGVETSLPTTGHHVAVLVHLTLGILTIATAAYLYCFRSSSWEEPSRSVADATDEEEYEITALARQAHTQSSEEGVLP